MSLSPGTRLGPYEIISPLGAGGMGEVYRARDTTLNRDVAIKVLPDHFARDAERLARFQREAQLLASLNHPHIAAIYGLEEANGVRALVLELVEGETLSERLARGALPIAEALDVCRQIASAVEAAHESGVIHRDLKPGNVKITPSGDVKVLDFGLAKGMPGTASGSDPNLSNSPTIPQGATAAGVILGTAAYMSPEQARGKAVDRRTDIWSFGCVLFECLTGRQTFEGETASDMIARILEREPDWAAIPTKTPERARELLRRCIEKDAKKRLRDIGDARIELEEALAAGSSPSGIRAVAPATTARPKPSQRAIGIAGIALLAGVAIGFALHASLGPSDRSASPGVTCLSVAMPPEVRVQMLSLSPDGHRLILLGLPRATEGNEEAQPRLYVRPLDRFEATPIAGTEGTIGYVFSPDGRWLAFVASLSRETTQRKLAKVLADGSAPPVTLVDWNDAWGATAWLHGGDLLIMTDQGKSFIRIPSSGGQPSTAVKIDAGDFAGTFAAGQVLPGDQGVLLNAVSYGARGYQVGVALLDPQTGKAKILIDQGGNAQYSGEGHLVFTRGDALLAVPFSLGRLEVTGEAVALAAGLRTQNTWAHGGFSLSSGGTLSYAPGGVAGAQRRIAIVNAAGSPIPLSDERRAFESPPQVSSDGRRVAAVITNARGIYEIWGSDLAHPGLRRVAALSDADCSSPVWSPDGERIAFFRQALDNEDGIYVARPDGRDEPRCFLRQESQKIAFLPLCWSPDGSALLILRQSDGKSDVMFLPVSSAAGQTTEPRPLLAGPFNEVGAVLSPDGRWIAYVSDETGKFGVYVCAFHSDGSLGMSIPVSSGGGGRPRWSADGKRIFYVADRGRVMSVPVSTSPMLTVGAPVQALDLEKIRVDDRDFDLLPDGRLLVIQKGEEEDDITRDNIVLNWTEELARKVSPRK
jgi:serine/threonine-protein kinase